jgi:signal transduction histidine kinase
LPDEPVPVMTADRADTRAVEPVLDRGPARVIAVLRTLVVVSMCLLVALGSDVHRTYLQVVVALLAVAAVYAATVLLAELAGRPVRQGWVTGLDTVLALGIVAGTGAAQSRAVAVVPLAVVAVAVRQGLDRAVMAALAAGAGYALLVAVVPSPDVPAPERVEAALWWSAYLVAFAVLTGSLRRLVDREHEAVVEARAEARADQLAYVEERDLRTRLAQSQQARDDGVRVLLHEFRTPVSSLHALTQVLTEQELEGQQASVTRLVAAHARHLTQMLDQVAVLAVTTGDPRGTARVRDVSLDELATSAVDAAGLTGAAEVSVEQIRVRCDEQQVRRILTNLLENAAKHGGTAGSVGLSVRVRDQHLLAEVVDRGPGLPAGQEHLVTQKYVSLGERDGTTGLGLWIVEQLVTATGGTLVLAARDGGGLSARVRVPLPR